jgi:hypothetical protein
MATTIDSRAGHPSALASPWHAAQKHSRYLRDLLSARPEIAAWLGEHAAQPLSAAQMSAFLVPEARLAPVAPARDGDPDRARHRRRSPLERSCRKHDPARRCHHQLRARLRAPPTERVVRRAARQRGPAAAPAGHRHGQARRPRAQRLVRRRLHFRLSRGRADRRQKPPYRQLRLLHCASASG